jgi:hypothetical protein
MGCTKKRASRREGDKPSGNYRRVPWLAQCALISANCGNAEAWHPARTGLSSGQVATVRNLRSPSKASHVQSFSPTVAAHRKNRFQSMWLWSGHLAGSGAATLFSLSQMPLSGGSTFLPWRSVSAAHALGSLIRRKTSRLCPCAAAPAKDCAPIGPLNHSLR